jgi:hypothetical protein
MNWLFSLYVAILFFILTPAVLLRIPKNGSKYTVAGVHAIVFALILHFTGKFVWNMSMSMEGFQEGATAQATAVKAGKFCQYGNISGTGSKNSNLWTPGNFFCYTGSEKGWKMKNPTSDTWDGTGNNTETCDSNADHTKCK